MKAPTRVLSPATLADLELPNIKRAQRMLVERFLPHERLQTIVDHIDFLFYRPPQTRAAGLVVAGEPGSGKTMLAKSLHRRYKPEPATDISPATVPLLVISMTGAREAKTLFNRMLGALGVPDALSYLGSDRERMVLKVCRATRVKMLIVDEIQDILTSTARQQRIALDTIKLLMNELQIPIIALGTSEAPEAMKLDKHLNARFSYRTLPVWKSDQFLTNFLDALEASLPLREASHLSDPSIREALVRLSGGILDKIVKMVCYAGAHAVEAGEERITIPWLERGAVQPPSWAVSSPEALAA